MWRLIPGQALASREWDGEAVLYNDLSGSTYLLDGAVIDLLHALRDRPDTTVGLAERLAGRFEVEGDLVAAIGDMLSALAGLDLIESC